MSGIYEYAVVWIELLYVPGRGLLFGILVLNPPTHLLHNEPGVTEADPLPSVCYKISSRVTHSVCDVILPTSQTEPWAPTY